MKEKNQKKKWTKPELVVLCPGGLKENVLTVTQPPPPPPPTPYG